MKKSELMDLLKDIDENAEIDKTIQGIEGLAKPLDVTSIGLEDFKNVLESNKEIKAYVQSSIDSGVGKGVASFKEKTLPRLIQEGIEKAKNKDKTPEQIELEEIKQKLANMEAEKQKAEMSSKYTKVLSDKGLSTELLQFVLGADDDITNANIETIEKLINSSVTNGIKSKITENPPIPSKGEGSECFADGVEKAFYEKNGIKLD